MKPYAAPAIVELECALCGRLPTERAGAWCPGCLPEGAAKDGSRAPFVLPGDMPSASSTVRA